MRRRTNVKGDVCQSYISERRTNGWAEKYGGMDVNEALDFGALRMITAIKPAVSGPVIQNQIRKEVNSKKW